jgi:hypothetical protein
MISQTCQDWLNLTIGSQAKLAYVFVSVKLTKPHGVPTSNLGRRGVEVHHSSAEFILEMMRQKASGCITHPLIRPLEKMLLSENKHSGEGQSLRLSIHVWHVKQLSMHNNCEDCDGLSYQLDVFLGTR